ncbi:hypothetical protein D3879_24680 [Pseudomonas cavernicola]|uniref:Uncharacterized protein n=1 Tax=Pseudomonas cavernicola TaxID=2320866 RepID=A0A418X974_9PSED|nr:hypothetical protein [Pseudomonas cavernicola]RJG09020.1 hypothetical protein D3879_24680 [Pseudomonas cavernicola]
MKAESASGPLRWHDAIGYEIRRGDYLEHSTSTYTLAEEALKARRFSDAEQLGRYTIRESVEAHELYRDWIVEIKKYVLDRGVSEGTLSEEEARIKDLLKHDNGEDFDAEAGWESYKSEIESFAVACAAENSMEALDLLNNAREIWLGTHDRKCDWVYALLDVASRHLGEECIGELWDALLAPMYAYYVRYDVDNNPWPRSLDLLMHFALEGLRGHLSGPGRRGDIEVFEEEDRWGMRFAPCGSGGRTYLPNAGNHTPLMEPPFNLAVTTEEHDWAWNKKGICLYCVHCCALNERMPMSKFGYPTRVIEPPTWPDAKNGGKCTWYIYKDPSLIPEEIYRRVGFTKPQRIGGAAKIIASDSGGSDN